MQRFRDGLVFRAHKLCVPLNSRLESNKEEKEITCPCFCGELLEPFWELVLEPFFRSDMSAISTCIRESNVTYKLIEVPLFL